MQQLINSRDLKFQLYELNDIDRLFQRKKFEDHNPEIFDAVLETAEKIAVKYFLQIGRAHV